MNHDEKIKELQERIYHLSLNINANQKELHRLQADLNGLKNEPLNEVEKKITRPSQTGNIESFIGLKLIHLVGIVVLVTGIAIGVKYAIDKELITEAMRIILAYTAGVLLFLLSLRLKKKYELFSAILFSGGMAILYFTSYAAFVYYQFLPAVAAFLIMTALTIYTTVSAISYNRQEIAVLGMIGAYGIPFLISTNSERVDLFFSYILLINMGVVFLSFKRSWKLMGQLALLITWILFIGWGYFQYQPAKQWIAFIFLCLYYLLFFINTLAFNVTRKTSLSIREIQQVVVNNTALYIAALVIFSNDFNIKNITIVTGSVFLFLALLALISPMFLPSEKILQRFIAWQALLLLVMFIAFQWDGLMVTLLWVVVSILLFIWGMINYKAWPRLASILLIGTTLVKLILFDAGKFSTIQKIISFIIIGVLLLLGSFYYQKFNLSQKNSDQNSNER